MVELFVWLNSDLFRILNDMWTNYYCILGILLCLGSVIWTIYIAFMEQKNQNLFCFQVKVTYKRRKKWKKPEGSFKKEFLICLDFCINVFKIGLVLTSIFYAFWFTIRKIRFCVWPLSSIWVHFISKKCWTDDLYKRSIMVGIIISVILL